MTNYYKATFSDGRVVKRSTARVYTHAWMGCGGVGFSSSAELAAKAAASGGFGRYPELREVVPVEEITAKEYRMK